MLTSIISWKFPPQSRHDGM
uniref:Uncharacterized protein n=1 Tax=Moniliophthora roreri TaxID=221103 RepID=A0A0W0FTS4_MONRR